VQEEVDKGRNHNLGSLAPLPLLSKTITVPHTMSVTPSQRLRLCGPRHGLWPDLVTITITITITDTITIILTITITREYTETRPTHSRALPKQVIITITISITITIPITILTLF
jgi:hypothetical protein